MSASKVPGLYLPFAKDDAHYQLLLETVANNATLALFIMNERQHCVFANRAAEQMTGHSILELQGRPLHDIIHHTRPDGTPFPLEECPIDRAFPENNRTQGEEVFVHQDGHFFPVAFTASPVRTGTAGSQIVGTIIEVRDITVEKAAEASRLELERARTDFFQNVSHDLRTPLTLLLGPLEELVGRGGNGRDLAEMAHRNALVLRRLVDNLLEFSRIEAGRADLSFRPVDLSSLTREVASAFETAVGAVGLRYSVDCAPLAQSYLVDPEAWERVISNLMSNALKFTIRGGITVRLREDDLGAVLEVIDTGVGIAADNLQRVFDRFHRGQAPLRAEGTGIGLALVKELVALHGGQIDVESAVGRGAAFRVRLPAGRAHLPPDRISAVPADPGTRYRPPLAAPVVVGAHRPEEQRRGLPLVLLVEDNEDMRAYISRLLLPHWDIASAGNGREALDALDRMRPDLILTDIMMPQMNGLELLAHLRGDVRTRSLPVILLSARAGEGARIKGLETGADDYLQKPFHAEELVARVRSTLELGRLRRDAEQQAIRRGDDLEREVAARTGELRHRALELEALNAELSALSYTMAHDLRAPLRAIHRYGAILREEYRDKPIDERGSKYADRIVVAAHRMSEMVTDLLEYARLGRLQPELRSVPLAPIFVDLAVLAEEHGGSLVVEGDVPTVMGDPLLIRQVFENLVGNACKFVPPGVTPLVTIRCGGSGDRPHIDVVDNGIGIDPEYASRIFGVFERLHGASEYAGTGVGLAIARRAAGRIGGSVDLLHSEEGNGATFRFELGRG